MRIEAGRQRHGRGARQQRLHRREQHRIGVLGSGAEGIDPAHLAEQPHDLGEGQQDADHKHAEDQAVEAGIGDEGLRDLAIEDRRDKADDRQENQHREKEDLRTGQLVRVVIAFFNTSEPKDLNNAIRSHPDWLPST